MIKPNETVILITGGRDWYDASADMVVYPGNADELMKKYREVGGYTGTGKFLREWVIENGGRDKDEQLDYVDD